MLHFHLQRGLISNVVLWHLDAPISEIMGIVCTKMCLLGAFAAPCCTIQLRLHHCHKHNFKHLPGAAPCRDQDRAEELCVRQQCSVEMGAQVTSEILHDSHKVNATRRKVCTTGSYFTCLRPSLLFCMILSA